MRLFPRPGLIVFVRGRFVGDEVNPGMPLGWDLRGLRDRLVDDPAARAVPLLVVDIAEPVLADTLALPPGVEPRAQRVAVPPREQVAEESHDPLQPPAFTLRHLHPGQKLCSAL